METCSCRNSSHKHASPCGRDAEPNTELCAVCREMNAANAVAQIEAQKGKQIPDIQPQRPTVLPQSLK
jgi:hypothetical protein